MIKLLWMATSCFGIHNNIFYLQYIVFCLDRWRSQFETLLHNHGCSILCDINCSSNEHNVLNQTESFSGSLRQNLHPLLHHLTVNRFQNAVILANQKILVKMNFNFQNSPPGTSWSRCTWNFLVFGTIGHFWPGSCQLETARSEGPTVSGVSEP